MKKILHIILGLVFVFDVALYATSISAEQKIYRLIFHGVFPDKNVVSVWVDDAQKRKILSGMRSVRLVESQRNPDLLLIAKDFNITSDKVLFVSSYPLLKHYKDIAIGGFYWKKGRPNLLFIRKNLRKKQRYLPLSLQKYVEEEL